MTRKAWIVGGLAHAAVITGFVWTFQPQPSTAWTQWGDLGDQFRIDARIVVFERRDAVLAPVGALFRDADQWAVFVAADGRAHKRRVNIGGRSPSDAWVEDGLTSSARRRVGRAASNSAAATSAPAPT